MDMSDLHDVMTRKLKEHSVLSREDNALLRTLPANTRTIAAGEDLVRQGDSPSVSIVVLKGMVGRYHTLRSGGRQYISFHITGDWPDAQTLFLNKMDHSVCAIDEAHIAAIPHRSLIDVMERQPSLAFAIWRETLIDAAIFREAITNNGKREITVRLAHFLCEQFYRAKAANLVEDDVYDFPLSQTQIGDALGSSLTTINRAMQTLRKTRAFELRAGRLHIRNWRKLAERGDFNPAYLHLRRPPRVD
jgi:CRP-like cAMP-binding protein